MVTPGTNIAVGRKWERRPQPSLWVRAPPYWYAHPRTGTVWRTDTGGQLTGTGAYRYVNPFTGTPRRTNTGWAYQYAWPYWYAAAYQYARGRTSTVGGRTNTGVGRTGTAAYQYDPRYTGTAPPYQYSDFHPGIGSYQYGSPPVKAAGASGEA